MVKWKVGPLRNNYSRLLEIREKEVKDLLNSLYSFTQKGGQSWILCACECVLVRVSKPWREAAECKDCPCEV